MQPNKNKDIYCVTGVEMKKISLISISFVLWGCGVKTATSELRELMNYWNVPDYIPGATAPLKTQLASLPDNGETATPVWQGYWYPSSQNGTAYKPNNREPSPMEKYDLAVGNSKQQATQWEIDSSRALANVDWAGHCNGLAAASTMEVEPKFPINYNNIVFSVDDVKALLIEIWQNGGDMSGGRCDIDRIKYDANGRIITDECRDINPATFHIILANFLGLFHKPVIADVTLGSPVWNYPAISYAIKYKQNATVRDVTYWLYGAVKDTYDYNPSATSFVYFQTEVTFTIETKIYEYILELNAAGEIIGGEWYGDSKKDHPDFLWRHTKPTPENPYLDVSKVYDIYKRSL